MPFNGFDPRDKIASPKNPPYGSGNYRLPVSKIWSINSSSGTVAKPMAVSQQP
jgi:hypothetical protein